MAGMRKGVKAIVMRKEARWGHSHGLHPESKGSLPESLTVKKLVGGGLRALAAGALLTSGPDARHHSFKSAHGALMRD